MRCPECDHDVFDERLGDSYNTIYTCRNCGCEFTEGVTIIKTGKREKNDSMIMEELCPWCGSDNVEETELLDAEHDIGERSYFKTEYYCNCCETLFYGFEVVKAVERRFVKTEEDLDRISEEI